MILSTLGVLISIGIDKERYFYYSLVVFILIVWNISIFIENYPRTWDSYWHFNTSTVLLNQGSLSEISTGGIYNYLRWPGSFLHTVSILEVLGIAGVQSNLLFLQYFPLFSSLASTFFFYIFFKRILEANAAKLSTLVFLLINVYLQFHYSPQAYGLILLPVFLYSLTFKGRKWIFIQLIVFAGIVVTHLPTTLFIIFLYMSLPIISKVTRIKENVFHIDTYLFLLLLVLTSLFTLFMASDLISAIIRSISGSGGSSALVPSHLGKGYVLASSIRFGAFVIASLSLLLFCLVLFKRKANEFPFLSSVFLFSLLFGVTTVIMSELNLWDRVPMFFYLIFAMYPALLLMKKRNQNMKNESEAKQQIVLGSLSIRRKRTLIVSFALFLIIIAGINSTTLYYREGTYSFSDDHIEGLKFIYGKGTTSRIIVMGHQPAMVLLPESDVTGQFYPNDYIRTIRSNQSSANFIVFSHHSRMRLYANYGNSAVEEYDILNLRYEIDPEWMKIYDAGDFEVFRRLQQI
jgi:hypothetical protein